ncbi:MAG: SMP-30/gluconolactonase/LRE family protein [Hahellaceae bacterium]|nr:SMP-30/gluconolactonase/LRE family protein [Hahellaceae bacterium]
MSLRASLYLTVIALIVFLAYRTIGDSGVLLDIENTFNGTCQPVEGVTGGEDITIDRSTGLVYISADDRWSTLAGNPRQGHIYAMAVDGPTALPISLTPELPFSFHPHGLSIFRDEDGSTRLFVVNHREDGSDWVEIFKVNGTLPLTHLRSITYPDLISPNDLVATGPETFYATSDHGFPRSHWMQTAEDYLGLPMASVTYFDGQDGHRVAEGLRYANGINLSADGKTLYVAEVVARRLSVFKIGPTPTELRQERTVDVGTGLDNLEWGDDGELWTGGHPRLFDFVDHAKNPEAYSPSDVVRINPRTYAVTPVYRNDGGELSGSSVATVAGKTLLIGPVFEHHLLRCHMN